MEEKKSTALIWHTIYLAQFFKILNIITENFCKILYSTSHFSYTLNKNEVIAFLEFYFLDISFFSAQFLLPLYVCTVLECSLDDLRVDNTPQECKFLQLPTGDSDKMSI